MVSLEHNTAKNRKEALGSITLCKRSTRSRIFMASSGNSAEYLWISFSNLKKIGSLKSSWFLQFERLINNPGKRFPYKIFRVTNITTSQSTMAERVRF